MLHIRRENVPTRNVFVEQGLIVSTCKFDDAVLDCHLKILVPNQLHIKLTGLK